MKIILANPRGFCAGVDRAVDIVDLCLKQFGAPIYVRKEIVHNQYVVQSFKERGVVFVSELGEVPDGARVVFSAHGISPSVRSDAEKRNLKTVDATCPLVTKVHLEVHRFVKQGYKIFLIGHQGHEEVEGTMGESPRDITLITSVEHAASIAMPTQDHYVYLTQTTLSVDETKEIIKTLKARFPNLVSPPTDDICYATQNRQDAVKTLAKQCDVVLVIGSQNSSNSQRLKEVAESLGAHSYLIDGPHELKLEWMAKASTVGITAGASAPEILVENVVNFLKTYHPSATVEKLSVTEETVHFPLPRELRQTVAG